MKAFLGPRWPSEATFKANVIKYANQEGSESFDNPHPLNEENFSASGRDQGGQSASHAELTPNGVGGFLTGLADPAALCDFTMPHLSPMILRH